MPGNIITYCDGIEKKSSHQDWIAADLGVIKNDVLIWDRCKEYETIGKISKRLGLKWLGDTSLNDIYHVELIKKANG